MSATAGYLAKVRKSGVSTSFTGEATVNTSGNVWRITDTVKRVWDRATVPTFFDDSVAIDVADISSIDYLFGEVTFTGVKVGPITVTGSYMPMSLVAGAKSVTLDRASVIHDSTDFSNAGAHEKITGMKDASSSMSKWFDIGYVFSDILSARETVMIEITPDDTHIYRGWFIPESVGLSLDITALLEESVSFQLDGGIVAGASFSHKVVS